MGATVIVRSRAGIARSVHQRSHAPAPECPPAPPRAPRSGHPRLEPHADAPIQWSGKRDSNPRPPAWKAGALPLSYSRRRLLSPRYRSRVSNTPRSRLHVPEPRAPRSGHRRPYPNARRRYQWWGGEDLNPRRRTPADLQSAPFGHLGTSPNPPARAERPHEIRWVSFNNWRWREESNPRPTAYKAVALPLSYASTGKVPI